MGPKGGDGGALLKNRITHRITPPPHLANHRNCVVIILFFLGTTNWSHYATQPNLRVLISCRWDTMMFCEFKILWIKYEKKSSFYVMRKPSDWINQCVWAQEWKPFIFHHNTSCLCLDTPCYFAVVLKLKVKILIKHCKVTLCIIPLLFFLFFFQKSPSRWKPSPYSPPSGDWRTKNQSEKGNRLIQH